MGMKRVSCRVDQGGERLDLGSAINEASSSSQPDAVRTSAARTTSESPRRRRVDSWDSEAR